MEFLKNTFLFRLYKGDKTLFAIVALFLCGTLFYTFSGREQFPFLLYNANALKEYPKETYTSYSIVIDGKEVNYTRLKDSQRKLMLSSIRETKELMKQSKLTKEQKTYFEKWLFTYSVDMRGVETNKMEVYELNCTYKDNGLPEITNKELLFSYATN
jgi:hypothetical protein